MAARSTAGSSSISSAGSESAASLPGSDSEGEEPVVEHIEDNQELRRPRWADVSSSEAADEPVNRDEVREANLIILSASTFPEEIWGEFSLMHGTRHVVDSRGMLFKVAYVSYASKGCDACIANMRHSGCQFEGCIYRRFPNLCGLYLVYVAEPDNSISASDGAYWMPMLGQPSFGRHLMLRFKCLPRSKPIILFFGHVFESVEGVVSWLKSPSFIGFGPMSEGDLYALCAYKPPGCGMCCSEVRVLPRVAFVPDLSSALRHAFSIIETSISDSSRTRCATTAGSPEEANANMFSWITPPHPAPVRVYRKTVSIRGGKKGGGMMAVVEDSERSD